MGQLIQLKCLKHIDIMIMLINNINEDTTKTFKIDHDGSLDRHVPEKSKIHEV